MQYQDILVHLEDNDACRKRLQIGLALCKHYEAQLCGIFIEAPWQPPAVTATNFTTSSIMISEGQGSIAWLERDQKRHASAQKQLSSKLRKQFLSVAAEHHIPCKFIPTLGQLTGELIFHSRYHDLAILGYTTHASYASLPGLGSLAAEVALQSGKPVLMVPHHKDEHISAAGSIDTGYFPTHPLVAWNESAEASRAVQDALPLLEDSANVTLYMNLDHAVHSRNVHQKEELKSAELHNYFQQHKVQFEVVEENINRTSTGEGLLQCARKRNNDLIIMGAYGHSRLKELLLGGTTRYVLKHTHLPVLMSH